MRTKPMNLLRNNTPWILAIALTLSATGADEAVKSPLDGTWMWNFTMPDGAHVNIVLQPAEMPQELKEELEAWQRAGDQAWQMIDKWEAEDQ